MAKLPERYEHLERRDGVVPYSVLSIRDCRRAIRRTIPTRHHAKLLFDAVVARLGERGVVDDLCAPGELCVYLRDPADARLVIGAPLVRLTRGAGTASKVLMRFTNSNAVLPEEAPDGWKPGGPPWAAPTELAPDIVPRGPEMCGGAITFAEGHGMFAVEYDERGVRADGKETGGDGFTWLRRAATAPYHLDTLARPPSTPPLSMLARPGLDPAGHTPEQFAALLVDGELARRVAWRTYVPVPLPETIEVLVRVARQRLRVALFQGDVPADARWVAVDGFEGRAIAWGTSIDDTLTAFRDAAFVKKPRPPGAADEDPIDDAPPPPIEPPSTKTSEDGKTTTISTGTIHISIPGRPLKFPWPRATPANVPAVLLPLPGLPAVPDVLRAAGYNRAVRCVGEHGAIGHVFVRDDEYGFTAIGEHVVDIVDPAVLDAELERADAELIENLSLAYREGDELMTERRVVFSVFDDGHRKRTPAASGQSQPSAKLGPPDLDGDVVPWRVVRERRTPSV